MDYHILVLEDDTSLLQLYGVYLARSNFKFTLEEFADNALLILKKQQIDLLIVDINLNQSMSGIDVIRHIRQDLANEHIKVLIASSFPERYSHLDLNITGALTKPIKYRELIDAVNTILCPKSLSN